MNSTVKDVMTSHVLWVHKDAPYKEMALRLRQFRISAFPVVDDDMKVIGVVSEADMLPKEGLEDKEGLSGLVGGILRRKDYEKAEGVTAGDLMSSPAITVSPDDPVEHAARLMYTRALKRLPVTDGAGRLTGIITRTDILAVFDRPDAEIRKDVTNVVRSEFLQDPRRFKVTVKDGIVTLHGEPESVDLGRELVRKARHVQGVVAVRDRLTYHEPDMVAAPGYYIYPPR